MAADPLAEDFCTRLNKMKIKLVSKCRSLVTFLSVIDSSSPHRAASAVASPVSPQVLIKPIKDAAHTHTGA